MGLRNVDKWVGVCDRCEAHTQAGEEESFFIERNLKSMVAYLMMNGWTFTTKGCLLCPDCSSLIPRGLIIRNPGEPGEKRRYQRPVDKRSYAAEGQDRRDLSDNGPGSAG